jgi:hypothetical protein
MAFYNHEIELVFSKDKVDMMHKMPEIENDYQVLIYACLCVCLCVYEFVCACVCACLCLRVCESLCLCDCVCVTKCVCFHLTIRSASTSSPEAQTPQR